MKLTHTLAALAATTLASNGAITLHNLAGSANNQANFTATSGFSFTTTALSLDTNLDSIDIAGPSTGATATVFTMEVYIDADNDATTFGLGALVGTSTNTSVLANNTVNNFSFSGVTLSDNQSYIAVFTDGTNPITTRFGLVNGNSDTGTTAFSAGAPTFAGSHDPAVTVNMTPEPSSTALLGLGGLALILRRRK